MKRQISLRISDATDEKLQALAARYGTQTEVVAVAVDRLWQQELAPSCERCGRLLPLSASPYYLDEGQSVWLCDECAKP